MRVTIEMDLRVTKGGDVELVVELVNSYFKNSV
jgi:hypothetical protein